MALSLNWSDLKLIIPYAKSYKATTIFVHLFRSQIVYNTYALKVHLSNMGKNGTDLIQHINTMSDHRFEQKIHCLIEKISVLLTKLEPISKCLDTHNVSFDPNRTGVGKLLGNFKDDQLELMIKMFSDRARESPLSEGLVPLPPTLKRSVRDNIESNFMCKPDFFLPEKDQRLMVLHLKDLADAMGVVGSATNELERLFDRWLSMAAGWFDRFMAKLWYQMVTNGTIRSASVDQDLVKCLLYDDDARQHITHRVCLQTGFLRVDQSMIEIWTNRFLDQITDYYHDDFYTIVYNKYENRYHTQPTKRAEDLLDQMVQAN